MKNFIERPEKQSRTAASLRVNNQAITLIFFRQEDLKCPAAKAMIESTAAAMSLQQDEWGTGKNLGLSM
jgi:hypothetical protein